MTIYDMLVSDDFKINVLASAVFFLVDLVLIVTLLPKALNFLHDRKWTATRRSAATRLVESVHQIVRGVQTLVYKLGPLVDAKQAREQELLKLNPPPPEALEFDPQRPEPKPGTPEHNPAYVEADTSKIQSTKSAADIELIIKAIDQIQSTILVFAPTLTPELLRDSITLLDATKQIRPGFEALLSTARGTKPDLDAGAEIYRLQLNIDSVLTPLNEILSASGIAQYNLESATRADLDRFHDVVTGVIKFYFDWPGFTLRLDMSGLANLEFPTSDDD